MLLEKYETVHGIYNHAIDDPDKPLAIVALHDGENTGIGSTLYERIELFAERGVTKHFGLSLSEFLELPTDVCDRILEISNKRQAIEGSVAGNMLAQLEANK